MRFGQCCPQKSRFDSFCRNYTRRNMNLPSMQWRSNLRISNAILLGVARQGRQWWPVCNAYPTNTRHHRPRYVFWHVTRWVHSSLSIKEPYIQFDGVFRQPPSRSQSCDSVSTVFGPVNAPAGYFNSSHMEDNTVGELRERIEDVRVLKSYVRYRFDVSPTIRELIHTLRQAEELQKSIDDCRFLVDTQATADLTGYRELRDWAKVCRITSSVNHFLVTDWPFRPCFKLMSI